MNRVGSERSEGARHANKPHRSFVCVTMKGHCFHRLQWQQTVHSQRVQPRGLEEGPLGSYCKRPDTSARTIEGPVSRVPIRKETIQIRRENKGKGEHTLREHALGGHKTD